MPTAQQTNENENHRQLFNQKFFGIVDINNENFSLRITEDDRRKSNYSILDYQNLINVIEQYSIKDNKHKNITFANSTSYGYKAAEKYNVQSYPYVEDEDDTNFNQSTITTSKIIVRKDNNKRLVAAPLVFDTIRRYHLQAGHKKSASTHNLISEKYCNITYSMVKFYIDYCPTCIKHAKDKNKKKKEKGPGKAIISSGFRDRIQMDLINYERDPQFDINGVIMRYLLVLKDHFTKFVWLRAIQHKDAKFVHHALRCLFHEIGFPLILHSDNGSEFVNQLIESFIAKESNSNTFMVKGAPRTPRVQGSVENINYHVQQCIEKTKDILRTEDNPYPSWLDCLPLTTSALNTTACQGVNKLTPYRHVYTVDHKLDIHFPNERARAYASRSLHNFHKYIADPVLKAKIETILHADQHSISSGTNPMPPTYIELPCEGNLKDDNELLNQQLVELSGDIDSISNKSTIVFQKPPPLLKDIDWSGVNQHGNTHNISLKYFISKRLLRKGYNIMVPSIPAVPILGTEYSLSLSNRKFKIIKGYLDDQHLFKNRHHLIDPVDHLLIAENGYYEFCKLASERWWENWLVETFFIMAVIVTPNDSKKNIAYLRIPSVNNPKIGENVSTIDPNITEVVSFAWRNNHYATIVYNLTEDTIDVFDGLANHNQSHGSKFWKAHIEYILCRCNAIQKPSNTQIRFPITIGGLDFKQSDNFNCGPIACLVMWFQMNNLEAAQSIETFSDGSVRFAITDKLLQWFDKKQNVIRSPSQFDLSECHDYLVKTNNTTIYNDDLSHLTDEDMKAHSDNPNENETSNDQSYSDEILKQHCEQILLASEYDQMRHSRKNKDIANILQRRQNTLSTITNIGDVVSLHVHKRDRFDKIGKNIPGIVFEVSKEKAMGIKAITEHGIIGWKNNEKDRWIGMEYFHPRGTDLYLPPILVKYKSLILEGKFLPELTKRITIQSAYKKSFPVPQKCKCRDDCNIDCLCKHEGRGCTKDCRCKGKCSSPKGELIRFDKSWVERTLSNAIDDFRSNNRSFSISNYRFSGTTSNSIAEGVNSIIDEVFEFAKSKNMPRQEATSSASRTESFESYPFKPNTIVEDKSDQHSLSECCENILQTKPEKRTDMTIVSPQIRRNAKVKLIESSGTIKVRDTGLFHKVLRESSINGIVKHVVNNDTGFGFSIEIETSNSLSTKTFRSFTSKSFHDFGNSFYYKVYGHWQRLEIQIEDTRVTVSKEHLIPTEEEVISSEVVDFGEEPEPDKFDVWYTNIQKSISKSRPITDQYKKAIQNWNNNESSKVTGKRKPDIINPRRSKRLRRPNSKYK